MPQARQRGLSNLTIPFTLTFQEAGDKISISKNLYLPHS